MMLTWTTVPIDRTISLPPNSTDFLYLLRNQREQANRTASSAARIRALALLQLSWYSASGSLSATTPPPA